MREWRHRETPWGPGFIILHAGRVDVWVGYEATGHVEAWAPEVNQWVLIASCSDNEVGKRVAQSYLGASMKRFVNCPVCDAPVKSTNEETIENVVVTFKSECPCGLFCDDFDAGVRHTRIGAVIWFTSWQEEEPKKWTVMNEVIAEAKKLATYGSDFQVDPSHGAFLPPLHDWFEEHINDFPLHMASLRERVEKNDKFIPPEET